MPGDRSRESRYSEDPIELNLDPSSPVPLYRQIADEIRRLVVRGVLMPGDRLPAVRELAVRCRVNRNTAARSVQALEREGLVSTRVGRGTFVTDRASASGEGARRAAVEEALRRFLEEVRELGATPEEALGLLRGMIDSKEEAP